ncbi:hypothetical protein LTR37_012909 [Vermiconidia calcicola]|uniref:Uncharacterized protein n=1 Tax=Vermiconidia calcicola TaxID=1690605 RepID=A0ACC3MXT4_9PEZI|nr:hypothetical protein LTR37_012909 [Vermiconidia calcicola]
MGSELPPDPYLALGVAKDASAASIKAIYRKLVLKCHPDKVQDEALKQEAADRFHKIQTAYEIIGDEERRGRYDAQCKLVELRKDVMESRGTGSRSGVDVRTAAYKMPTESTRGGDYFAKGDFYAKGPDRYAKVSPHYEERRPSYEPEDYFDQAPRASAGRYDDYERPSSKRSPPREERAKAKASTRDVKEKENERSSRKEKSRRTDKDVRRDRERKNAYATVEPMSSDDSDPYLREWRRPREEDELPRVREERAREDFWQEDRPFREAAESGIYAGTRAHKTLAQESGARDYIQRSALGGRTRTESERRPSPARHASSQSKVESLKAKQPSLLFRRGSGKPTTIGRDTGRSSRDRERGSSVEVDEPRERRREETREAKRPPTLNQTKSSPAAIRPPFESRPPFERQRSQSMQEEEHKEPPVPHLRRSETTPMPAARDSRGRKESSKLARTTPYISPDLTPESERKPYRYGAEYADDMEYPTPDGYRTKVVEPPTPGPNERYTRSPSPIKATTREKPRAASSRHAAPQQPPPPMSRREESYSRPAPSRAETSRLYGEVPTTRSPRPTYTYSPPPPESVRTQREVRPEDIKFQTGYSRRGSHMNERPSYNRSGSSRQPVYA